jgi:CBS domain-containing protein
MHVVEQAHSPRRGSADIADPVTQARAELERLREHAREQEDRFSLETQRSWRELDRWIEDKLDDLGARMIEGAESADDATLARIQELSREVQRLIDRHLHCPVAALMNPNVRACAASDSLERAAELLWDNDCGALPVVDSAGIVQAMITDRDICMALYTQGLPARECTVASAMSKQCHTCAPGDSVERVAELMSHYQVRRLPVVDADGRLRGILSIGDVARYLDSLCPGHASRELLVPTLAAISYPRTGAVGPLSTRRPIVREGSPSSGAMKNS